MQYKVGQRFVRRFGVTSVEHIIINDPEGMWVEIAEQQLSDPEQYERYLCTTGQMDDEQELGYIERDGDVSPERLAEIRKSLRD